MIGKSDSKIKGDLLERVVALLHQCPGLKVERNYRYPVEGDETDTRDIDVLVTTIRGEAEIKFPIECKNYKSKVDIDLIDSFVGKLKDIGISPRLGIYVCVNGYTIKALRRAAKEGIRPLVLKGLTQDRLSSAFEDAFGYVIYLLPELGTIQVFDDCREPRKAIDTLSYRASQRGNREIIVNNVWQKWFSGDIPRAIGCHTLRMRFPSAEPAVEGAAKDFFPQVNVIGLVVESSARFSRHQLENVENRSIERIRMDFEIERKRKSMVHFFGNSKSLDKFLKARKISKLVIGPIALPRVQYESFFWPISADAAERARDLLARGEELSFEAVEGLDLSAAWADFLTLDYAETLASYEIEVERLPSLPIHHSAWVERQTEM